MTIQSFSFFLIRLKTKALLIRKGSSTLHVSLSKESVFFFAKASSSERERGKNVVKRPLGRYRRCLRLSFFCYSYFIPWLYPPTLFCLFCFHSVWISSLDPSTFISFILSPTHIWLFAFESIIRLVSQCDRSPQESYWEHFPGSLSHGEKRLSSLHQRGPVSWRLTQVSAAQNMLYFNNFLAFKLNFTELIPAEHPVFKEKLFPVLPGELFRETALPCFRRGVSSLIITKQMSNVMHGWRSLTTSALLLWLAINEQERAVKRHLAGSLPFAYQDQ